MKKTPTVLREANCPAIDLGQVVVVGYGNQGCANARNLHDSGVKVSVALRSGSNRRTLAEEAGLTVCSLDEIAAADLVAWAIPDEIIPAVAETLISVKEGQAWLFLHGLVVAHSWIIPPPGVDLLLLAPQGPGTALRSTYESGSGLPGVIAIERDSTGKAEERLLGYARAVGCARGGLLWSSFAEETVIDHFGEQAVLCGGVPALVEAAWQTLVDAGHDPRLAYIECLMQLKLLAELMYERGVQGMYRAISPTARFGAETDGRRVIGKETEERLHKLLVGLEKGDFARRWQKASQKSGDEAASTAEESDFEQVGRWVREQLNWQRSALHHSADLRSEI